MQTSYDIELAFAKRLAVEAKKISDKYFRQPLEFKTKADASPVTIADETINQQVIDSVQKEFPNDGVLGEEQSWHEDRNRLWVCDPIDGTIGFSMGMPIFMFSIALVIDGRPVVAVTGELATGRVFWATSGGGAFLDGKPIFVSQRVMSEAWLAIASNLNKLYDYKSVFQQLNKLSYQTNIIHGSVYKGMLVAQGFADGDLVPGSDRVHPWDVAAVKLIVEEAGGRVTDQAGQEQRYDKKLHGIVISNGKIHQDILDTIKTYESK